MLSKQLCSLSSKRSETVHAAPDSCPVAAKASADFLKASLLETVTRPSTRLAISIFDGA